MDRVKRVVGDGDARDETGTPGLMSTDLEISELGGNSMTRQPARTASVNVRPCRRQCGRQRKCGHR